MAITKGDANQAKGIDKAYLLAAILLEQAIQKILDDTANDMYDLVMKNASASGLQDSTAVKDGLAALLAAMFILYDGAMEDGITKIAAAKKAVFVEQALPILRAAGATAAADSFNRELNTFESKMVTAFRTAKTGAYDLTFDDRKKVIQTSSEKVIRNLVDVSVRDGLSAKEIAQRLDAYMNPTPGTTPVRPWDVLRNATKSLKGFTPDGVLPGSVQYNLYNTARTLSAETYRDMTTRAFNNKSWVKGYRWVLSRSHPVKDICDELAEHGVYKKTDKRPFSHNQCLCDWVVELMSVEDVAKLVASGKI